MAAQSLETGDKANPQLKKNSPANGKGKEQQLPTEVITGSVKISKAGAKSRSRSKDKDGAQ